MKQVWLCSSFQKRRVCLRSGCEEQHRDICYEKASLTWPLCLLKHGSSPWCHLKASSDSCMVFDKYCLSYFPLHFLSHLTVKSSEFCVLFIKKGSLDFMKPSHFVSPASFITIYCWRPACLFLYPAIVCRPLIYNPRAIIIFDERNARERSLSYKQGVINSSKYTIWQL